LFRLFSSLIKPNAQQEKIFRDFWRNFLVSPPEYPMSV